MRLLKKGLSIATIVVTLLVSVPAHAQSNKDIFMSQPIEVESDFTSIGVNWNPAILGDDRYTLHLRFFQKNKWTPWYYVSAQSDYSTDNLDQASAFFATNQSSAYQYMITDLSGRQVLGNLIDDIEFTPIHQKPVLNYDLEELVAAVKTDVDNYTALSTSGNSPKVISRKQWGADEGLRVYSPSPESSSTTTADKVVPDEYADETKIIRKVEFNENGEPLLWPQEYPEKVRKIFIHHTATTANLDNPRQAIRDIYYWHAISRKWGDIGYNYLIDPEGNVYEGRAGGETVVAAHAAGANTGSIGIAVLGNFQESEVSSSAFNSLVSMIRAKTNQHNIDPIGNDRFRGETMPNIVGHRDFSATACPGEKLYSQIPLIRSLVASDFTAIDDDAESYDFQVISKPTGRLVAIKGTAFEFQITIRNTGSETWKQAGRDRIAIVDFDNRVIGNLSEPEVKPGATGTFYIKALTPDRIGDISFKIKPIIGEKTTFDNAWISIPVNVFAEPYKGRFLQLTNDRVFRPGEVKNIWMKFRNEGSKDWNSYSSEGFQFTYLAPTEVNILRGNIFEEQIKFGEEGTILVTISAPLNEGEYMLYFQPWVNGHGIMDYRIEFPITVSNDPDSLAPPAPQVEKILKSQEKEIPKVSPPTPATTTNQTETKEEDSKPSPDTTSAYQSDNPLIRIALSFIGDPIITGDGPFEVFNGEYKLAAFESGEKVRVTKNSADYEITSGNQRYYSNQPPKFVPGLQTILEIDNFENRPEWNKDLNDNIYRGNLEVFSEGNNLRVINELPLETYLRGIGEVSNSSHPEKIKSIIVAARTYAHYYIAEDDKFPGKPYDLDDSPERSQKYLGYGLESRSPKIVDAIRATAGEVVTYNNKLIKTPYFNQSDGRTRSAQEVWGWSTTPYLKSVDDKYCTADKLLGHGVGLSGCGATGMAEAGFSYKEILKYFYQGVEVTKL